jgi:hypothetical protein
MSTAAAKALTTIRLQAAIAVLKVRCTSCLPLAVPYDSEGMMISLLNRSDPIMPRQLPR